MNGRCETCSAEKVCVYPYKPTECANQRKFEMHPDAVDCPNCNGADKVRDGATDAADRIEQLEAERDELTACLNLIYSWANNWDSEFMNDPDWINTDYPRIQAAIAKLKGQS